MISSAAAPDSATLTARRKRNVAMAGTSANQGRAGLSGPPVPTVATTSTSSIVSRVPKATSSGVSLRSIQRSIVIRWSPAGTNSATVHQPFQGAPATTPSPIAPAMITRALPMRALASMTRTRCAGVGQSHARSESILRSRQAGAGAEADRSEHSSAGYNRRSLWPT